MTVYFYSRYDKAKNIFQPFLQRSRQIYRGHRDSAKENLESHQFRMDVEVLRKKIEDLNQKMEMMAEVSYFHDSSKNYFEPSIPFFNASFGYYESSTPQVQTVLVDDVMELSAALFRLNRKIKLLENQEN